MKALYRNNSALGPGNGFIVIDGLDPLPNLDGLRFLLKRGSDHHSLGPGGWQGAESALEPKGISLTDTGFALAVDNAVVDNLDPRESYRFTLLTADGVNSMGRLEVPEVAHSLQGAEHGSLAKQAAAAPEPEPTPEPVPEPMPEPMPEPVPEPEQLHLAPDAPPAKKKTSLLILLLIIVLAGIAAGIGAKLYFDHQAGQNAPEPPKEPEAPKGPEAKPALTQAREHLSGTADPAQSLILGKELLKQPESADAAFLLLEDAAQKGNAEAMLLTGGFYDPADASPSGSIFKDPAQAFAWYKKAKETGNVEADARLASLRDWAESESAKGNAEAKALLKNK